MIKNKRVQGKWQAWRSRIWRQYKTKISGVFVAVGTASSTDIARKIGARIENNNIVVNENMETTVPGLFACGDCTGGLLQISKAIYEGTKAGLAVLK